MKSQENDRLQANLEKADYEIQILRDEKQRLNDQILVEKNNQILQAAKHKEEIDKLNLDHSY